ncbi:MAG TPA: hypothetical protein DCE41_17555 [Cytophagales bacterium]|nr:hypothetical protein [Cytophagales bacterium]HAA19163.1 hypothetical protein [Cytophagales bacterium]HAP62995.1 hypothetical protein [Cytophagales bacterium]
MKKLLTKLTLALGFIAFMGLGATDTQEAQATSSLPFIYYVTGTVIDTPGGGCWYVEDCSTGARHYFDRATVPGWVTILPGNTYQVEFNAGVDTGCGFYSLVSAFSSWGC